MKLSDFMPTEGREHGQDMEAQQPENPRGEEQKSSGQQAPAQKGVLDPPKTKEDADLINQLVTAGMNILNEKEAEVMKMLGGKEPAKGLASATDMIIQSLSEQMGSEFPLNIQVYGGIAVMKEIFASAQASGIDIKGETFGKGAQYYIFSVLQKNNISPESLQGMFEGTPQGEMQAMLEEQAGYSMA